MAMGHVQFLLLAFTAIASAATSNPSSSSSAELSGPWPIVATDGSTCFFYRIRRFAIRGFNLVESRAPTAMQCGQQCADRFDCNSFEYSYNRFCYLSENDIYDPATLDSWNNVQEWDYYQLRDCEEAAQQDDAVSGGASGYNFNRYTTTTTTEPPMSDPPVTYGSYFRYRTTTTTTTEPPQSDPPQIYSFYNNNNYRTTTTTEPPMSDPPQIYSFYNNNNYRPTTTTERPQSDATTTRRPYRASVSYSSYNDNSIFLDSTSDVAPFGARALVPAGNNGRLADTASSIQSRSSLRRGVARFGGRVNRVRGAPLSLNDRLAFGATSNAQSSSRRRVSFVPAGASALRSRQRGRGIARFTSP